MKLISWNIDSLNATLTSDSNRAVMSREVMHKIIAHEPDVIAIQETKLPRTGPTKKHQQILNDLFLDYDYAWRVSEEPARKSYAGTMFIYKKSLDPAVSYPKIDAPDTMDSEGRIMTLEFDDFIVTQVYTPNSGSKLVRLNERQVWDEKYAAYLKELDARKPVLATGDFNVAHKEIDIAHPDRNRRSAGFTDEERLGFTKLLGKGFVDTFRHLHGDVTGRYSWWNQRAKTSKVNNSGWRIDYWLVSKSLADKVQQSDMLDSGARQDHTPLLLEIDLGEE
ncbi:exodeoxyribonuclease III [Alkalibacterium kapii]|uniref:Exodeoxyribonuclease n=1 Tax=Alkalibacterium kapii TaxID=426704 RepID=A0A511ATX8_9LACT|nr:exodeoxyribonuclease III [Alkalibacterium kapii]GEK91650.1 exodeoxyribonuclease III [Alkalibacterium kapii]